MIPIGLKCQFLVKLHESHLGVVKLKLLARTLIYWPNWNDDVECVCNECKTCRENQHMPPNIPKFQVNARGPGEVYGCDVAEIHGHQHLVVVDFFSCYIFKRKLSNLASFCVIEGLKDIFCDVGSPDKLITYNAHYFVSEEFTKFMMELVNSTFDVIPKVPSWKCSC